MKTVIPKKRNGIPTKCVLSGMWQGYKMQFDSQDII